MQVWEIQGLAFGAHGTEGVLCGFVVIVGKVYQGGDDLPFVVGEFWRRLVTHGLAALMGEEEPKMPA